MAKMGILAVLQILCGFASLTLAVPWYRAFTSSNTPQAEAEQPWSSDNNNYDSSGKLRPIIFMHGVFNDDKEPNFAQQYIPTVSVYKTC